MKTIHKFTLEATHKQYLKMPAGARVLSVQGQHNKVAIWALVETGVNEVSGAEYCATMRCFVTYTTGSEMPDDPGEYLGTAQLYDGNVVIHVFEEK